MASIANRHIAANAHAILSQKILGTPGTILPRGAKGAIGAPMIWNQTRVPIAGRVTGQGDTPVHPISLVGKK